MGGGATCLWFAKQAEAHSGVGCAKETNIVPMSITHTTPVDIWLASFRCHFVQA
jgi:hypothetical protein